MFPTSVVEFIAQKFLEGKQYSTLNLYRSALLATIPPKEGHPVGQHPLVCRALQGSFNQRPPMPKYTSTWDVNTVVLYLKEKMGDTPTLNLKALSSITGPVECSQSIRPGGSGCQICPVFGGRSHLQNPRSYEDEEIRSPKVIRGVKVQGRESLPREDP